MQHQSQQGDGESSSNGEIADGGTVIRDACSENEQTSSKETYTTSKLTSTRTSSTNTQTSQFSLRKPAYNTHPRQPYYRNNNSSRNGARSRNTRSNWQSGAYGSYRPSYQPWTGSNSAEEEGEEVVLTYNEVEEEEAFTAEETQLYRPQSAPVQQIDPVVALERICSWLGSILRRPDLARKLTGARLELGMDEKGNNKATFWLAGDGIDPASFSLEDKSLIRMAFSTEIKRGYQLQLRSGQVVLPLE